MCWYRKMRNVPAPEPDDKETHPSLRHTIISRIEQANRSLKTNVKQPFSDQCQGRPRLTIRPARRQQSPDVFHKQLAHIEAVRNPDKIVEQSATRIVKPHLMSGTAPGLAGRSTNQQLRAPL